MFTVVVSELCYIHSPLSYGEQGVRAIDATFHRLLTIAEDKTLPLTPQQFASFVLTPEAGVMLIMQDHQVPRDRAIQIMLDSASYGTNMFPVEN